MRLWRISEFADLAGYGGTVAGGRWHSKGHPIAYLSETIGAAMLEVLVHLEVSVVPASFQLIEVDAPDDVEVMTAPTPLPTDTVAWGDAWLAAGGTALARVPSAVVPRTSNFLLNPRHRDAAKVKLVVAERCQWDARLFPAEPQT